MKYSKFMGEKNLFLPLKIWGLNNQIFKIADQAKFQLFCKAMNYFVKRKLRIVASRICKMIGFKWYTLLFLGIIRVWLGVRLNMYEDRINIDSVILQSFQNSDIFKSIFMVCNYNFDCMIFNKGFCIGSGHLAGSGC